MSLYHYKDYIIDSQGRPVVNCNIAVLSQQALGVYPDTSKTPGSPLATIFYDEAGNYPMPNPISILTNDISYSSLANSSIIVNNLLMSNITTVSTAPGQYILPHGLETTPISVSILMTSNGRIWEYAPPDDTNLYLEASDTALTATITLYSTLTPIPLPTTAAGNGLDGQGNFGFYAGAGYYTLQFYGGSLASELNQFDIGLFS